MLVATIEDMTERSMYRLSKPYPQLHGFFVERRHRDRTGRLRHAMPRRGSGESAAEFSVSANEVQRFERQSVPPEPSGWHVNVGRASVDAAQLLDESPGTIPLVLHIGDQAQRSSRGIANAPYVRSELEQIVGTPNVRLGAP